MIATVDENHVIAYVVKDGKSVVVARARRKSPRAIWNVWYLDHVKSDTARPQSPHARISSALPKEVQSRMIVNLLDLADH